MRILLQYNTESPAKTKKLFVKILKAYGITNALKYILWEFWTAWECEPLQTEILKGQNFCDTGIKTNCGTAGNISLFPFTINENVHGNVGENETKHLLIAVDIY